MPTSTGDAGALREPGLAAILVVDDERDLGTTLQGILTRGGAAVTIVCHPDEAVAAAGDGRFDVAIVDLRLPGRDGIELMVRLREMQPWLQVIIMTAYPSPESCQQALRLGAAAYLEKPYAPEALRALVGALLAPPEDHPAP